VFNEVRRDRLDLVRGPAWWTAIIALAALMAFGSRWSVTTMTTVGLVASLLSVIGAEVVHRRWAGNAEAAARSQTFSGAAIAALGVATGPVAVQLRAGVLTTSTPYVWLVWACSLVLLTTAALQIVMGIRRLIVDGRRDTERLMLAEREALEAELLVQQQRLEPALVLRAMTVIADQAEHAPREAERSIELLAGFLRKSLTTAPAITAPLSDEVTRAHEYADILAAGGLTIPITWKIDDDVRQVVLPGGTLRTFLDYAVSRCLRTPGAGITISASQHAKRFYLIVKDSAAPDPPMLDEPEGLTNLRRRLGAPPRRRVRVETSVMFEVDGTPQGTTQTLSMLLPEAA